MRAQARHEGKNIPRVAYISSVGTVTRALGLMRPPGFLAAAVHTTTTKENMERRRDIKFRQYIDIKKESFT